MPLVIVLLLLLLLLLLLSSAFFVKRLQRIDEASHTSRLTFPPHLLSPYFLPFVLAASHNFNRKTAKVTKGKEKKNKEKEQTYVEV